MQVVCRNPRIFVPNFQYAITHPLPVERVCHGWLSRLRCFPGQGQHRTESHKSEIKPETLYEISSCH